MSHEFVIPEDFYRESWEDAEHPMACVDTQNKFVRVNAAFERLLGYSNAEMVGRAWMEFTVQKYVGGDLASVNQVLEGKQDQYQLEKDYVHKRGHHVPVCLTVRRFPRQSTEPLLFFRVEAPLATATRREIEEIENHTLQVVNDLRRRLDRFETEKGVQVNVSGRDITTDNTDRTQVASGSELTIGNHTAAMRVMTIALVLLAGLAAALLYVVASRGSTVPLQQTIELTE